MNYMTMSQDTFVKTFGKAKNIDRKQYLYQKSI